MALASVTPPPRTTESSPATPSADSGLKARGSRKFVVNPAVDHVDLLRPAGRAHEDPATVDEQILALDQFDAHLLGQEDMLEIGGVQPARRQHDDRRVGPAGRARRRADFCKSWSG